MHDTAKYLIHADITADGVVERSDVVGAIFGQTEGLLGDDLDLRDLQDASKVGRIDVDIDSENGQSFGTVTIATSLDKVETAILAASLETIDRVGPCHSTLEISKIEDVRAAKRRSVVTRAKRLLSESFDGEFLSSQELIDEVRRSIRVEDITEYEGYPAGPRVEDSDAIIVVEGRADVLRLLQYGIKNAIAVEGTNVPEPVAELTRERTVTAFLDGDRGGDLILKELAQVGEVDYVAFAPPNHSVEDLDRHAVMAALRDKVPYELVADASAPQSVVAATDGSAAPAPETERAEREAAESPETPDTPPEPPAAATVESATEIEEPASTETTEPDDSTGETGDDETKADETKTAEHTERGEPAEVDADPETVRGHAKAVFDTGTVRLLSESYEVLDEGDASAAFDLLKDAEQTPTAVVLDGELSQRVLDVAAQRGVEQVVAAAEGEFVKRPTSVRVRTREQLGL